MKSRFIVDSFRLWIDYGWYHRLAIVAIFHFNRQITYKEVRQRMKRVGFHPGNYNCLVAAWRARQVLPNAVIVAPATKDIVDGTAKSPYFWIADEEISLDYVYRYGRPEIWQKHWHFFAVKWIGKPESYPLPVRSSPDFWKLVEGMKRTIVV